MKNVKTLISLVLAGIGLVVISPVVRPANAAEAESCLKAEYVHNGQCQGSLVTMCSGPPECFRDT